MDTEAVRHGRRPRSTPTPLRSVLVALAITCLALWFSSAPAAAQSAAVVQYGNSGQDGYMSEGPIILSEVGNPSTRSDIRTSEPVGDTQSREISTLPFTGLDLIYGLALGGVLIITGVGMRRLTRAA